MKILIVEDHFESRQVLQRMLERRGHEVVACPSAEEAQAALAHQSFPFLLLDWMLPGKSGIELCRHLRAQPGGDEMFILLVTARADTEDLQQALDAGANDYLSKPLDFALLDIRLSVAERQIRELGERNQARAALHESVERTAGILEKTSDGYFTVDRDWNFTYLNAQAEIMLKRKRETLLGQNLWVEYPEMAGSVLESNYRRVLTEHVALQFEMIDTSGKIHQEIHAYPSGGGISVFFRDITERKKSEEERLTTSKLESLGTLAGGIAHDLNNILTVISGNIGLAQIEAPSNCGNLLSFLAKAGQGAQHAARLSTQLLTFSKGGTPHKKIVAPREVLQVAAELSLYGSNVRAEISIPDNLWKVEVDAAQIEQVMNALIINAREATPQGGSIFIAAENYLVEEKTHLLLPPGRYLRVAVTDHGTGVAEDLTTKIFDPYFTTKTKGTGLGLSIGYSIMKKHDGVLRLEASNASETTFAFYLPAATKGTHEPPRPNERLFRFNHHRVLVMDDEEAIRELTSQLLTTLGYEVTAVEDGHEAVRTYERALRCGENFQAVILDATIRGGMGGLATIEKLRSLDPNVTAIICSGYSDDAAVAEFLSYGFRGSLPKPFTRRELANALQKAFENGKVN